MENTSNISATGADLSDREKPDWHKMVETEEKCFEICLFKWESMFGLVCEITSLFLGECFTGDCYV